jgi:gamma-glutamyltranspeptidase/glutathione hydrolase
MPARLALVPVVSAAVAVAVLHAQAPGDRPAPNPRSTRSVVMARNGLIATSQPLASAAGLQVLQAGGTAADAAVAAAAVLAVVEPTMTGIGGDLFALVYDAKATALRGLNASGRSPYAATVDAMLAKAGSASSRPEMPDRGILPVTVPGVVDGWAELLARHGTMPLDRLLAPAIRYARDGFGVAEIVSHQWQATEGVLARDAAAARVFLPGGRAPRPGEIFRNPGLAATLERIGAGGRDAFYRGPIAAAIVADAKARGGLLDARDFAEHRSDWVEPIGTSYRGHHLFEMPPNTQGIVALEMLNLLEGFDLKALGHNSAEYLHLLVEAKRIAFADRNAFLSDADTMPKAAVDRMLSKEYAAARRAEIAHDRAAGEYAPGAMAGTGASQDRVDGRDHGDTIYLTVADGRGNVISLIQSIFSSFGAGIVAGETGIVLHNRGAGFTLADGHPNRLAPHKRPMHTLVPAMAFKDGRPWVSYGVMGGDMQPQGHVQVLLNLVNFGMNVQEAGEAARFRHSPAGVALESAISPEARFGLLRRGHRVVSGVDMFGGFQGILFGPAGVLMGGSDPRKDGLAIGF